MAWRVCEGKYVSFTTRVRSCGRGSAEGGAFLGEGVDFLLFFRQIGV